MNVTLTPIHSIFTDHSFQESFELPVCTEQTQLTVDKNYVPEPSLLNEVASLMSVPEVSVIGLQGESGTGKTELVSYLAAHLNLPLHVVHITKGLRTEQIMGEKELVNDEGVTITKFIEANAVKAYKEGGILLFDEVDKLNEELSSALHPVFDKKPWTLSTGETIQPHPHLFIFTTSNTVGDGLSTRYITSMELDSALRRRITWVKTHYPTEQVEMEIIKRQFPMLKTTLIADIVKVANGMRDALLGVDRDGNLEQPVGEPFDVRATKKWASLILRFANSKSLQQSFMLAHLNGVTESDHEPLLSILDAVLGDKALKTLAQLSETKPQRRRRVS